MARKVCIIGGGNWGTVLAKMIGENIHEKKEFDKEITMWIYEETINNRTLTDYINNDHENVKYLPNIKLPKNIKAISNSNELQNYDTLIFAIPHQFVKSITENIKISKNTIAISVTKGFIDENCETTSDFLSKKYSIPVGALMGANIANEIGNKQRSNSTLACKNGSKIFKNLLECCYFRIKCTENILGAEYCGALKNIVAVAYGIASGLNMGENSKAIIVQNGIYEIKMFLRMMNVDEDIIFESCGISDLVVTCMAGRNCKFGEELAAGRMSYDLCQGKGTAEWVYNKLKSKNKENEFKMFTTIHLICSKQIPVDKIFDAMY